MILQCPSYDLWSCRYETCGPRYVALLLSFLNQVTNRSLGLTPGTVWLPVMNNVSAVWPLAQARTHQRCLISRASNRQQKYVMTSAFCCAFSERALVRMSHLFQAILCVEIN
jgi:hypothetical protein